MATLKASASQTIIDMTDGFTVSLSQDSAAWNGGVSNLGTAQSVSIAVSAYQGASVATYSVGTPTCSDTANCTATKSGTNVNVTVKATATKGGTVTIPVTCGPSGSSVVINKTFSYSISLKGEQGDDGYTPVKGKDYFDGENGAAGADAILLVITYDTMTLRNNTGKATMTAHVYVGGVEATVASETGVVTFDGKTLGTVKWYVGSSASGTAGKTFEALASEITNQQTYTAQLEA